MKKYKEFLNENNINDNSLYYIIDESEFKSLGYKYQELFASDVPYYHKKLEGDIIWCRVEDKEVTVNDWYDFLTPTILRYFLEHKEESKYSKMFDYHFLELLLNRQTGKIIPMPFILDKLDASGNKKEEYKGLNELILPVENTEILIDELRKICGDNFEMELISNKYNL